ncbi:hypothetical protein GCM10007276_20530 [Agaricicola taiwanensis]|uniref:Uncharacterized protein n=1 Tax=Agaricicola taiwanensis TaxID=591372 RepID=A0A8J2YHQ0_9RHOB|nr:hypothetical protein [Agaricicola taiwanensis]GGE43150.1 hypothetical protein GCM10007276_20530 [Agaricicola taiwanensis]
MRKTSLAVAIIAAMVPFAAQSQTAPASISRDQVRTRLLDGCVYDMSREADPLKNRIVPKCSCYGKGVSALMSPEEIAAFGRDPSVPRRIKAEAEKLFASCS